MLCDDCEDKDVIPEFNPTGSECKHSCIRADSTLCERCSTRKCRCQGCGKTMLTVVKNDGDEKK